MYILWFFKYDIVENELFFEFKKGKIERKIFVWLFKRMFICVFCYCDVIIKMIIDWGSVYDDIRIVYILEIGIIVF